MNCSRNSDIRQVLNRNLLHRTSCGWMVVSASLKCAVTCTIGIKYRFYAVVHLAVLQELGILVSDTLHLHLHQISEG